MYNTLSKCVKEPLKICNLLIQSRFLSAKEISTALRQFYFSVHPDLFGKYPNQRVTNENSLKQLSSYIEAVKSQKTFQPCTIQFYLKKSKNNENENFQLVDIPLKNRNIRNTIINILKTCKLSTEYIDTITPTPDSPRPQYQSYQQEYPYEYDINNMVSIKRRVEQVKKALNLRNFLKTNYKTAFEKREGNKLLKKDIETICDEIYERFQPKKIKWDCGWNEMHYRGCLQSFKTLANNHPEVMSVLKNRILVFAQFTGVSLDGHIMLNSGEVQHNWLDLIKNIKKRDTALLRIPSFEKAVSQVLKDIQVVRRKFMPKINAEEYEEHLRRLMTNLIDYCGSRGYPKSWPDSLKNYQIVVETSGLMVMDKVVFNSHIMDIMNSDDNDPRLRLMPEAGPLMVSPTGQFIAPSSCPGYILVSFITDNLENAARKTIEYNAHKHIEKILRALCMKELKLADLRKDDNVTPELMIKCCETLLENKSELILLEGMNLNISTYYSVLSDGVVCIPWNFII